MYSILSLAQALSLLLCKLAPGTAPDKNKSVLAAAFQEAIFKNESDENKSHKSSMISLRDFNQFFRTVSKTVVKYVFNAVL